jgi:hypothetical protein
MSGVRASTKVRTAYRSRWPRGFNHTARYVNQEEVQALAMYIEPWHDIMVFPPPATVEQREQDARPLPRPLRPLFMRRVERRGLSLMCPADRPTDRRLRAKFDELYERYEREVGTERRSPHSS